MEHSYIECGWCGAQNRTAVENGAVVVPNRCFKCGLYPAPKNVPNLEENADKVKKAVAAGKRPSKSRQPAPRMRQFDTEATGRPVIGVDPGARYTGVVVRDADLPIWVGTLVRPDDMSGPEWAVSVVDQLRSILEENSWESIPMGIEGVNDPKGFHKGKKAALNPKDIIRAGMVVGAVYSAWRGAYIIPPGGNGTQHISHYPDSLVGRRPKTLPGAIQGAKTRNHEQSAYDVAGKTQKIVDKKPPRALTVQSRRDSTLRKEQAT